MAWSWQARLERGAWPACADGGDRRTRRTAPDSPTPGRPGRAKGRALSTSCQHRRASTVRVRVPYLVAGGRNDKKYVPDARAVRSYPALLRRGGPYLIPAYTLTYKP